MAGHAARPHILVCDDESTLRDLFQDLLEDEGYRVTVLPSICDDLAEVMGLEPDLILLDVLFAGQPKGNHFLQRLKTNLATIAIPVLICSAAAGLADEQLAKWQCGAVAKPFDLDELMAAVSTCLGGRSPRWFDP